MSEEDKLVRIHYYATEPYDLLYNYNKHKMKKFMAMKPNRILVEYFVNLALSLFELKAFKDAVNE